MLTTSHTKEKNRTRWHLDKIYLKGGWKKIFFVYNFKPTTRCEFPSLQPYHPFGLEPRTGPESQDMLQSTFAQ